MSDDTKADRTTERASRIPTFATVDEEAAFWDSHDFTEFEDELESVEDIVFDSIRTPQGLLIRLDGDVLARLDRIANAAGVDSASIARRWIEEGLEHEAERDPRLAS
jgi:hypothetical protein